MAGLYGVSAYQQTSQAYSKIFDAREEMLDAALTQMQAPTIDIQA